MPALDPRRERFARLVVKTGNQRRSYMAAGYRSKRIEAVDAHASALVRSRKVKARIQELQMRIQRRQDVTEDSVIAELVEAKERAYGFGQVGPAVNAIKTIAQIAGLLVDRKEVGAPGDFSRERNKDALYEALVKRLGKEQAQAIMTALAPKPTLTATPRLRSAGELDNETEYVVAHENETGHEDRIELAETGEHEQDGEV
jgi:Terminase small subunit